MNVTIIIVAGLFGLSVISGMLGLGVAFAAIPFLGFFLDDLVHEIQPLSLILNGITASFSAFGFSRSGLVDWRRAGVLCLVTTTFAPIGSWLAQSTDRRLLWVLYFCAVVYLAVQMFRPAKAATGEPRYGLALLLAIPISVLSGLLGVGPGFLLLPCLILLGVEPKHAAAINAVAVTPPSFSALIPHIGTMKIDPALAAMLIVAGAAGSFLGARLTTFRPYSEAALRCSASGDDSRSTLPPPTSINRFPLMGLAFRLSGQAATASTAAGVRGASSCCRSGASPS